MPFLHILSGPKKGICVPLVVCDTSSYLCGIDEGCDFLVGIPSAKSDFFDSPERILLTLRQEDEVTRA